jgi:hypothetical protein
MANSAKIQDGLEFSVEIADICIYLDWLAMLNYVDGKGNSFELEVNGVAKLRLREGRVLAANDGTSAQEMTKAKVLEHTEYMRLSVAFQMAIENRLHHRELAASGTGMITRLEDGQQRRYILCPNCQERESLENALWEAWESAS